MPSIGGKDLAASIGEEVLEALAGPTTCTIYLLEPTTLLPIEPIVDIVPAVTPFRQALDVVTSSTKRRTFSVTPYPVQGGPTITPHVHKQLDQLSVTGVISGSPSYQIQGSLSLLAALATGGGVDRRIALASKVPGFPQPRRDLMQLQMLELLSNKKFPVMVVTPEGSMPKAWIRSIVRNNSADMGEATDVQLDFVEARIVSPLFADALLDLDETLGGAGSTADAGGQPTSDFSAPAGLGGGLG